MDPNYFKKLFKKLTPNKGSSILLDLLWAAPMLTSKWTNLLTRFLARLSRVLLMGVPYTGNKSVTTLLLVQFYSKEGGILPTVILRQR